MIGHEVFAMRGSKIGMAVAFTAVSLLMLPGCRGGANKDGAPSGAGGEADAGPAAGQSSGGPAPDGGRGNRGAGGAMGGPGGAGGGPGGAGGGPGGGARVVPVVATQVERRDVPIFLEGLGNVVAFKTVAVRPQVDGRLEQVLFREGQEVKQGAVLAQIDRRPFLIQLHQAEGAQARDSAQLRDLKLNLERYKDLRARKLIAQQQVDDQAALVGQLEGAVQIDQAAIESAKLNLDYARILAPIDGTTGIRQVDPGNIVHAADPTGIVVITQLDPISMIFTLPEDELPRIAPELARGQLPVEAWSRDGRTRLAIGKLGLVDNQINASTGTVRLKAIFENPQHLLWPNQFIKARLQLTTRKDALVVPSTVVQRGAEGTYAYVINQDQTVAPRAVEVELTQGDQTLIAKGLAEGEQVVVDGQAQLRAGAKVLPRPFAAQKPPLQRSAGDAPRVGPAR
jgi:membrane fusion protein, multidrug efflux system